MRRAIQNDIEDKIAEMLIVGDTLKIGSNRGKLKFDVEKEKQEVKN